MKWYDLSCVRVGGDGSTYRLSRHSGPITAPVLPSQDWNVTTVTRGVATANQVYSSPAENGLSPYLPPVGTPGSGGIDYSTPRVGAGLTYPVVPTSQLLELDLLKLQHEAVKQSVETASMHPKDVVFPQVGGAYRPGGTGQQEWLSSEPTHPSSYPVAHSQPPGVASYLYTAQDAITDKS